jgi:dephospho-CoA kinase
MTQDMRTIGVTGGIGSGKSTVAGMLGELGATVINADRVGHEVYEPGTRGWQQIVDAFGQGVVAPDGTIDRKRLGTIVFADPAALKRLNAIVHPLIHDEIARRISALRASHSVRAVVVEAAILIEANWLNLVEEVWLVVAGKQAVIERVRAERALSEAEIQRRIDAQLSDDERCRFAHVVIENKGSFEALRAAVLAAWEGGLPGSGNEPNRD